MLHMLKRAGAWLLDALAQPYVAYYDGDDPHAVPPMWWI